MGQLADLDQHDDDQTWAALLGPAYSVEQVATLLGITPQAVSQRPGLLRLQQRDGYSAYPVFQFDGDAILPGVEQVVLELTDAVATTWTIASWLQSPDADLGGRRPHEELVRGNVTTVVTAARQWAAALSR
jgi:hypothetical protein